MFNDPSSWQVTASESVGFMLTEYFVLTATDQQLTQIFNFLSQHHLQLMMLAEMVPVQANGVGNGVEGFASGPALANAVQRIKSLGGTLNYLSMDSPLIAGRESSSGPQLSVAALAAQVAVNVAVVQAAFPNVKFQDSEGLSVTPDLVAWTQAFKAATGTAIAQVDADVDWSASSATSQLAAFATAVRSSGAVFGVIGNSTSAFTTDQSWALAAETNIAAALANPLINPSDIQVESWNPNPTVTLPEGLSGTLTHVALETAEISPLYSSGFLTGGAGLTVSTAAPTPSYVGSAMDAVAGAAVTIPGVKLTAAGSSAATATFAAVVTDVSGAIGATASGAGHVSGAGTNVVLLTGDLADINAELASLTYQGAAAGTDTIDITTYDSAGLVDDHVITVAVAAPLTVALPTGVTAAKLYANIFGTAATPAILAAAQSALTAGQTLAQVAAPWMAQGQSTITALYEQVMGVSPTAAVITSLTAQLAGGTSIATIRGTLAGSAPVQSELTLFYKSHYGQAPTTAQLAALTQQVAAGASLQSVEAPLLANSAATAQITTLYQQMEGQAPDAASLSTQARALLTGTTLATLRTQLAASALVQGNISALYQHVYDAAPTTAQLASYTAQVVGTSWAQVQAQFTATAQSMVKACYLSALNRSPTNAELTNYTTQLTTGVVVYGAMLTQLAFSAESGANVTAMYQQIMGQAPAQSMVTLLEQCLCVGQIPLVQLKADLIKGASLYLQITGQPVTADTLSPIIYQFLGNATLDQISFSIAHAAVVTQILGDKYQALFGNAMTFAQGTTLEAALQAGTTTMAGALATLTAQAAADMPLLSGVVASQYTALNNWELPFASVSLADSDPNALEHVTVSLIGGNGHLSNATNLNVAGTLYNRTGLASDLQNALRGMTLVAPTTGGTATLLLTVQNGAGNSVNSSVTIGTQPLVFPSSTTLAFLPAGSVNMTANLTETFVVSAAGFGKDTIASFGVKLDVIQFAKTMVANFASVQRLETAVSGGTLITVAPSSSIYLPGITPGNLVTTDFRFV